MNRIHKKVNFQKRKTIPKKEFNPTVSPRRKLSAFLAEAPKGRWVSIDPSINTPGFAIWEDRHLINAYAPTFGETGNNLAQRIDKLSQYTKMLCHDAIYAIVEVPDEWVRYSEDGAGYFKQQRALNVGPLMVLSFAVGGYLGTLSALGVKTYPAQVEEWKGRISKKMMHMGTKKMYPQFAKLNDNGLDAIALGDWALKAK